MNDWFNKLEVAEDLPMLREATKYPEDLTANEIENEETSYSCSDGLSVGNSDAGLNMASDTTNSTTATGNSEWDPWHPPYAIRVSRTVYSIVGIYMSFVLFLAVTFNGLVLYTVYKNRVVRTPLNYIVINLTVADLIGALLGDTLSVMANAAGRFFLGKPMCVIEAYTASVTGVAGLISVAVMAFERYFVVCKPIGPVHFSERTAAAGVAATWIYSFVWHFPMLVGWNGFEAEGFGTNCAPNYWITDKGPRGFLIAYFVGCFVIPYLTIFFAYGKLISTLRAMKKESMVSSSSGVSADQEVTKMVVVLVLAFAFCWCPYAVVAMTNVFLEEKIYQMGALPAFFAKSAAVYNPIIYIGLNKQFRDCVMKTLFKGMMPRDDNASMMSSQVSTSKVTQAA